MNQPSPPLPETPLSSSASASELLFQWVGTEGKGECFPFSVLISCRRRCLVRSRAGVKGPTNPQTKGFGSLKKIYKKIQRPSNNLICFSTHWQSSALQLQIFRLKESRGGSQLYFILTWTLLFKSNIVGIHRALVRAHYGKRSSWGCGTETVGRVLPLGSINVISSPSIRRLRRHFGCLHGPTNPRNRTPPLTRLP